MGSVESGDDPKGGVSSAEAGARVAIKHELRWFEVWFDNNESTESLLRKLDEARRWC